MGRLVQLRGRRGFYAEWTDAHGKWRRIFAGDEAQDAKVQLADLEAKAARERRAGRRAGLGLAHDEDEPEKPLAELVTLWREHLRVRRRPKTWLNYSQGLREVFGWLRKRGNPVKWPGDVRLEDLESYAAMKLAQPVCPRTVNLRIGAVRALFRWGLAQRYLRRNPIERWEPLAHEEPRRRRALTEMEIARLLAASSPEDRDTWMFFLGTGLRAGELAALEEPDINWENRQVVVRAETSKSTRTRAIPIRKDLEPVIRRQIARVTERQRGAQQRVDQARAALARARKTTLEAAERRLNKAQRALATAGKLLFANEAGGAWQGHLSRRLKPCLRAAGLPEKGIDLHTLRHTFASHLARNGVDLRTLMELLGHNMLAVTEVYLHPFNDRLTEAVEAVPLPCDLEVATAENPRKTRATAAG